MRRQAERAGDVVAADLIVGRRAGDRGDSQVEAVLEQLLRDKDAIEREIGTTLQWNPNPDNRDKTILLSRGIDLTDRNSWSAQVDWLVDMNAKFRQVFMPRIKKLDLSATPTQPAI